MVITIDEAQFRTMMEIREVIPVIDESFLAISGGAPAAAMREFIDDPGRSLSALIMGGYSSAMSAFCLKMVGRFEGRHTQTILLLDARTGEPEAMLSGGYVCDFRTGAATASATRVLARTDTSRLAVIGTGAQAVTQVQGVLAVRPIESITVWNRTESRGRVWIETMRELLGEKPEIRLVASAEEAVTDADIVIVATSSQTPLLRGEWLATGTHVNAVGAGATFQRELHGSVLTRADVIVVDVRGSALKVGDFIDPLADGLVEESSIAEMGEILLGHRTGRDNDRQITLFKSVGHIANDIAVARAAVEKLKPGIEC